MRNLADEGENVLTNLADKGENVDEKLRMERNPPRIFSCYPNPSICICICQYFKTNVKVQIWKNTAGKSAKRNPPRIFSCWPNPSPKVNLWDLRLMTALLETILSAFVHFYPLSFIFIHFHSLLPIFINFHLIQPQPHPSPKVNLEDLRLLTGLWETILSAFVHFQ